MKKLKELLKTDIYGEPVYGQHVNLLHQKMTADDDDDVPQTTQWLNRQIPHTLCPADVISVFFSCHAHICWSEEVFSILAMKFS